MPDFMGGLAKGIEKSKGMVAKAIEGVSQVKQHERYTATADKGT